MNDGSEIKDVEVLRDMLRGVHWDMWRCPSLTLPVRVDTANFNPATEMQLTALSTVTFRYEEGYLGRRPARRITANGVVVYEGEREG